VGLGRRFLIAAGCVVPVTAQAQDNGQIVITATRQGETRLDEVPFAVSVVRGATIEETGIDDLRDLAPLVPGMHATQTGPFAQLFLRGVGSSNVFGGSDPSVTVQLDGVYVARPAAYLNALLDVERVEVVRGTQAALYGRNAIAGTINVISRAPSAPPQAMVRLGVGSHGAQRAEARLSGPVMGGVHLSLAMLASQRDGYLTNVAPGVGDVDDERAASARGQVAISVLPGVETVIRGDRSWAHDALAGNVKILAHTGDPVANSVLGDYRRVALNYRPDSRRESGGVAVQHDIALGTAALKLIAAWRHSDMWQSTDSDATALDMRRTDQAEAQRQFSQEATLAVGGDGLRGIVGAHYFRERIDVRAALTRVGIDWTEYAPVIRTRAVALYASGTTALSDTLSLSAGLRFSAETKRFDQDAQVLALPSNAPLAGYPLRYSRRGEYRAWSPHAGLEWRPSERALLFASIDQGFKSGGFNFASQDPAQGYAPERLIRFEGGAKLDLGDGVRLNPTIFHYDYRDLQVQSSIAPGVTEVSNAAYARIRGMEIEAEAQPLAWLKLGGNLALLDARYRRYPQAPVLNGSIDAAGKRLRLAPKIGGAAFAEMRGGALSGRIEASYRSRQYFTPANGGLDQQAPYALVNASLSYALPRTGVRLSLFARNLTDAAYLTTTAGYGAAISGRVGEPRTIGARIEWAL
jgi:iron complex outermembrane receptor protein